MEQNELKVQEMIKRMSRRLSEEIERQIKEQHPKITIYTDGYRTETSDTVIEEMLYRELTEEQKSILNLSNSWLEQGFNHLADGEKYLESYYEMIFKYYNGEKIIELPQGFPNIEFDLTDLKQKDKLTAEQKMKMYEEAIKHKKAFKTFGYNHLFKYKMNNSDKIYFKVQEIINKIKSDILKFRGIKPLLNEKNIKEPVLMSNNELEEYMKSKGIETDTIKKIISREENNIEQNDEELEKKVMEYVENGAEESRKPGSLTEEQRKEYEEKAKKMIQKMWEEPQIEIQDNEYERE